MTSHVRFEDQDDALTQLTSAEIKINQLRQKVRSLKSDDQNIFANYFITWLSPLVSLGKRSNLTITDIPQAPVSGTTPIVVPKLYSVWSAATKKLQLHKFQQLITTFNTRASQRHASGSFGNLGLSSSPSFDHPAPPSFNSNNNITARFENQLPTEITTVAELKALTHHQPLNFDLTSKKLEDRMALRTHLASHPAIIVMEDMYENDTLPVTLQKAEGQDETNTTEDREALNQDQAFSDAKQPEDRPSKSPDQSAPFSINDHPNLFAKQKETEPTTLFINFWAFRHPILLAAICEFFFYTGNLLQPFAIKLISRYFTRFKDDPGSVTTLEGLGFALFITLVTLCSLLAVLGKQHLMLHWASNSANSYLCAVFDKSLRISPYAVNRDAALSVGSMTNLTSQDSVVPFTTLIHLLQNLSGPISIMICLGLMFTDFGSAAIVTTVLMMSLIPYQLGVAKVRQYLKANWLKATDARIKYTLNILQGLRVAKLYAWEIQLQEQLQTHRNYELRQLRKYAFFSMFCDVFTYIFPLFVTYITVVVYVKQNETFTPAQIVVLMSYLNAMRLPIQFLGQAIGALIELYLSGRRIGHFLSKEELPVHESRLEAALLKMGETTPPSPGGRTDSVRMTHNDSENYVSEVFPMPASKLQDLNPFNAPFIGIDGEEDKAMIEVKNADFYWSSFEQTPHQIPVLANISFRIKRGEIFGVIGSVGLGKSALINGMLGELYPQSHKNHGGLRAVSNLPGLLDGHFSFNNHIDIIPRGLVELNGKVAYCQQQPFLMNATIRENIIMDLPYDEKKFHHVIKASALGPDLEILINGEFTECSNTSLSGGQSARVQFARALYHADVVDIVICDDPFAAVDAQVARTMFFQGLRGILRDKAVVLVLNSHYDYLKHCHQILCLDQSTDPYWLLLHQYILNTQNQLINKKVAQKVLEMHNGDFSKSYSSLANTVHASHPTSTSFSKYRKKKKGKKSKKQQNDDESGGNELDELGSSPSGYFEHKHVTPLKTKPPQNQFHTPANPGPIISPRSEVLEPSQSKSNLQTDQHPEKEKTWNPLEADVSDINLLVGYRQPSTIAFQGTFEQLTMKNLPLLGDLILTSQDNHPASSDSSNSILNSASSLSSLSKNDKLSTVGDTLETFDRAKSDKTVAVAAPTNSGPLENKHSKGGPSQAQLPSRLYLVYFQGSRGKIGMYVLVALFLIASVISQVFRTGSDVWLIYWSEDETRGLERHYSREWWYISTLLGMIFSFFFFLVQSAIFLYAWLDASRSIHKRAVHRVFRSTIAYLDTTPLGQIVNKIAGKDVEILDSTLPDNMLYVVQQGLILAGIIFLSCLTSWIFIIPLFPMTVLLYFLRQGFHASSVQCKRIESAALSPIYSLYGSVLKGATTIRAYGYQQSFIIRYRKLLDTYMGVKVITTQLERRFAFYLNVIAAVYIFLIASTIVFSRTLVDTDLGMLAITYSLRLVGLLQLTIRFYTSTTQSMTALQRMESLSAIPQEPQYYSDTATKSEISDRTPPQFKQALFQITQMLQHNPRSTHPVPKLTFQQQHAKELSFWPWYGRIEYKNVTVRYRPELPIVLNNLSFTLLPGESCGCVARTGAGKSTLLQTLFLTLKPESGSIEIDGIDITRLGIADLRSRLAIIPQSPTLFTGTIRTNLDPLGRFPDELLWAVCDWVSITKKVLELENGLDSVVDEGGGNISISEKQLLCIGRALLTQFRGDVAALKSSNSPDVSPPPSLTTPAAGPRNESSHNSINNSRKDFEWEQSAVKTSPLPPQTPSSIFPVNGSILLADEMTSSVPLHEDQVIQQTIRSTFAHATMIVIAHRLATIIDLDKVLVLKPLTEKEIQQNVSSLVEFDIPWKLLNDEKSLFYQMCMQTGVDQFTYLYNKAKEAYFQRILPHQVERDQNKQIQEQQHKQLLYPGANATRTSLNGDGLLPSPMNPLKIFPSDASPLTASHSFKGHPLYEKPELDTEISTIVEVCTTDEGESSPGLHPSPSQIRMNKQLSGAPSSRLLISPPVDLESSEPPLQSPDPFAAGHNDESFPSQVSFQSGMNYHHTHHQDIYEMGAVEPLEIDYYGTIDDPARITNNLDPNAHHRKESNLQPSDFEQQQNNSQDDQYITDQQPQQYHTADPFQDELYSSPEQSAPPGHHHFIYGAGSSYPIYQDENEDGSV